MDTHSFIPQFSEGFGGLRAFLRVALVFFRAWGSLSAGPAHRGPRPGPVASCPHTARLLSQSTLALTDPRGPHAPRLCKGHSPGVDALFLQTSRL